MITLLRTKLKMLVNSGIPGNNTLVDAQEATCILAIMSEYKKLQEYCQGLEDEIIGMQANVNNTSKRLS